MPTIKINNVDYDTETLSNDAKAQLASIEMMKPGVVAETVDAKAREVFDEIGLANHFGHGLGHGQRMRDVGLAALAELAMVRGLAERVRTLQPGNVICLEVGREVLEQQFGFDHQCCSP